MAGPGDLFALANEYLEACHTGLQDTAAGPPARYFISPGPPAWDCCPQLSVHVGGPMLADTFPLQPMLAPGHRVQTQGAVNLIALTATIIRCVPMVDDAGNLPQPAALDAASEIMCADLWAIWQFVKNGKRNGSLFQPNEREMFFDPAAAMNQQGGCGGWQITIRVQLDGYVRTGS